MRRTYNFATNDNRTLTYTISYKPHADYVRYVTDVSILGCYASNSDDYKNYCGEVAKIVPLPKDADVQRKDDRMTTGCVSAALLGGGLLAALLYTILN